MGTLSEALRVAMAQAEHTADDNNYVVSGEKLTLCDDNAFISNDSNGDLVIVED